MTKEQKIAELAYRFWEERGRPEAMSEDDWYKAELIVDQEQDREGGTETSSNGSSGKTRKKRNEVTGDSHVTSNNGRH